LPSGLTTSWLGARGGSAQSGDSRQDAKNKFAGCVHRVASHGAREIALPTKTLLSHAGALLAIAFYY
jgi:hypothetical protein